MENEFLDGLKNNKTVKEFDDWIRGSDLKPIDLGKGIPEVKHVELTIINYSKWAVKYLSDQVKAFKPADHVVYEYNDEISGERKAILCQFMQVVVHGREVEERDVKFFCEAINKCAELGLIERATLAPMFGLPLTEGKVRMLEEGGEEWVIKDFPKRTILCFYAHSRHSLEYLREHGNQWFTKEGSLGEKVFL